MIYNISPKPKAITLGWDQVIDANKSKAYFTVTPEFGAPPYIVLHPKTGDPLVDQWEVNVWMMDLFKKRYSRFSEI